MIDGPTYRIAESLARRQLPSWHIVQFQRVAFVHSSFPENIESLSELGQLLDSMQENRFERCVAEIGGLSPEELDLAVEVFVDTVVMQRTYMPDVKPRIPYSTVMAHLLVYQKLKRFDPQFRTVLEIGPGCGFLSFFLRRHAALKNYSQIEACEAFYLMQGMVNAYSFPGLVDDQAYPSGGKTAQNYFTLNDSWVESTDFADVSMEAKCTHYPWWRLGDIKNGNQKFQIVVANANLKEFSTQALCDYLHVVGEVLEDDGILFCQCLGGEVQTRDEELRKILFKSGFAPLVYLESAGEIGIPLPGKDEVAKKNFTVGQGLFVKKGHPQFDSFYRSENYQSPFIAGDSKVLDMYFDHSGDRKIYSRSEVKKLVEARLTERLS